MSTRGPPIKVELAKRLGMSVVELQGSLPLGPALALNEGVGRLLELDPSVQFIQFTDGDCELREGWIDTAARRSGERDKLARHGSPP